MKLAPTIPNTRSAAHAVGHARGPSEAASPHIVIRGESHSTHHSYCHTLLADKVSFIDYFSFTYKPQSPEILITTLIDLFNLPTDEWVKSKSGWYGYEKKIQLGDYGLVAWGGKSQKGTYHVEITGVGCNRCKDWLAVYHWGVLNRVKITRLDIAHDDLSGEILNIEKTKEWITEGAFTNKGRPPNIRFIDDYDSGSGKTFYIGNRKNGRLIRIYEKGKQLGDAISPWCRAEIEFRSKDRVIPWDAVINPDPYISGSCKAFSYLSHQQSRIKTTGRAKAITLEKAIEYCRIGYGQLINALLNIEGLEPYEIIELLKRSGIPKKLKHKYEFANL